VTRLERWQRFSLVYTAGMVMLSPLWIATLFGSPPTEASASPPTEASVSGLRLLLAILLPPLVAQTLLALRLFRPTEASVRVCAVIGALLIYCSAWLVVFLPGGFGLPAIALALAGAAAGQALATGGLHLRRRHFAKTSAQAGTEAPDLALERGRNPRITVSLAASIGGSIAGVFGFALFVERTMDDVMNAIPHVLSLWTLFACAAFLILYLGRSRG
jgi:hypothetical protein